MLRSAAGGLLASRHFTAALPLRPLPPQAAMPIGLSPPSRPPSPCLAYPHPLPFPREVVPTGPPDCPCSTAVDCCLELAAPIGLSPLTLVLSLNPLPPQVAPIALPLPGLPSPPLHPLPFPRDPYTPFLPLGRLCQRTPWTVPVWGGGGGDGGVGLPVGTSGSMHLRAFDGGRPPGLGRVDAWRCMAPADVDGGGPRLSGTRGRGKGVCVCVCAEGRAGPLRLTRNASENFPQTKNEMYQRGQKLEVDLRYADFLGGPLNPLPPPPV